MISFRNFILASTLLMTVMLFTDSVVNNYRLGQAIWNMGHLFFFAALIWLILCHSRLKNISWLWMLIFSLIFSTLIGGFIELIQYFTGRYMELKDLLTDILGGILGYLLVLISSAEVKNHGLLRTKSLLYGLIITVILLAFYPTILILQDNIRIQASFPMLANFETDDELIRWVAKDIHYLKRDNSVSSKDNYSLHVQYGTSRNPHISLKYFPSDWSAYRYLNISIYNEQLEDITVELKLSDRSHKERGYVYSDRYNKPLRLTHGWNYLKIPLLEIYNAPQSRNMNMQELTEFSFYMIDQDNKTSIYIDNIHLSND